MSDCGVQVCDPDLDRQLRESGNVNVFMSYDHRSDIFLPYGMFRHHELEQAAFDARFGERSNLAVGVISNCEAKDRLRIVHELRQHFTVNIFGDGGCSNVEHHPACGGWNNGACFPELAKTYKFYVAIENTDCVDYITEKVWRNALRAGMVPIVYGKRTNYAAHMVPGSYINCADYDSIAACAKHIQYVGDSESAYNSYHAWRVAYEVVEPLETEDPLQLLCEFTIKNNRAEKAAVDVALMRDRNQQCNPDV